ncbi:MAG: ATP-dependent Clp protease adapter ClpS [Paraperlucidibaca sp.]
MSREENHDDQPDVGHTALIEPVKPELQRPKRYQVVLVNDDYTPMEFVIEVLELFFGLTGEHATRLMLQVHHLGKAGIGSYSRDVAETKAAMVVDYARQHEHPLLCLVEPMP